MKRLFISAIISAVSILAMAQTQSVTHVVQRGETIESIAEYYHVSVADINKANPNAEGIVYVGMKLVVPVRQGQTDNSISGIQERKSSNTDFTQNTNATVHSPKTSKEKSFKIKVLAGITAGQWMGKDFKNAKIEESDKYYDSKSKLSFGFHIGVNADYSFTPNLYTGIGLMFNQTGYKKKIEMSSGKYWNDEGANYESEENIKMTTNKLDMPIHIGGAFNVASHTKAFIEVGPILSYAISGNNKRTGYRTNHDDIHSGETEPYNEKVKIGKGELKDYQKFGYGLLATVGISHNNILFQFTYQHGLSKTIKKTKQYEQNLLLSIGYIL